MRFILTIAGKDLRLRVRDRSVFVLGLLAPFLLAVIFDLVLGAPSEATFQPRFAVADLDTGPVGDGLVGVLRSLAEGDVIELDEVGSVDEVEAAVEAGDLDAAFVIPAGFSQAVTSGGEATLRIVGNVDAPISVAIAEAVARGYAAEVEAVQLSVAVALQTLPSPTVSDVATLAAEAATMPPPIELVDVTAADRVLDTSTFFIAGMAVFFLFFTVSFGVVGLLEERQAGTLARLAAAPIPRYAAVAAKMVVSYVVGVVAMAVLVVASTLILDARWGDPVGVAVLVLAAVAAAVGVVAVVAGFARTAEQASTLQAIIAVSLGMIGGVFFPTNLGGGFLAKLALASPHRWFMNGLADLAGGGGLSVVWPSVAGLLAFAVVTTVPALYRLRTMEPR